MRDFEAIDTVVIGGGQAGLSVGYHLARRGVAVRDPGRHRPDRRRLAQPLGLAPAVHARRARRARRHAVPGAAELVPDQGPDGRLSRGLRHALRAAGAHRRPRRRLSRRRRAVLRGQRRRRTVEASNVVVAMARFQRPRRARRSPTRSTRDIVQLHSSDYQQPVAAQAGRRAGGRARATRAPRSRCEVAPDGHPTWLSGRNTRRDPVPARGAGRAARAAPVCVPGRVPPDADHRHPDRPEGARRRSSRKAGRSSGSRPGTSRPPGSSGCLARRA